MEQIKQYIVPLVLQESEEKVAKKIGICPNSITRVVFKGRKCKFRTYQKLVDFCATEFPEANWHYYSAKELFEYIAPFNVLGLDRRLAMAFYNYNAKQHDVTFEIYELLDSVADKIRRQKYDEIEEKAYQEIFWPGGEEKDEV